MWKVNDEKVMEIYNLIISKKYGDIILHKQVEKILGFTKEMGKYGLYIKAAKDMAIEKGLVLKAIPGKGWQILKPKQVSSYTYRKYINRALNMYNYSSFILENVKEEELNETRLKELEDVKLLNQDMKKISERTIKNSKYYTRKDYYNSLKD